MVPRAIVHDTNSLSSPYLLISDIIYHIIPKNPVDKKTFMIPLQMSTFDSSGLLPIKVLQIFSDERPLVMLFYIFPPAAADLSL